MDKGVLQQRLKQWLGEDRLADGWIRPPGTQGLIQTITMAKKLDAVKKVGVNRPTEQINNQDIWSTTQD